MMETQEAILTIDVHTLGYLTKLLRDGAPDQRKTNFYDEEVTFHDGTRMAIQVCPGEGESAPWTRGVLFTDSGEEIGCSEPGEELIGHYRVEYEGQAYVCHVTPAEKVFGHDELIQRRVLVYHLSKQKEALKTIDTREGWSVRRMGPMLIGPSTFSARLGEVVAERYYPE